MKRNIFEDKNTCVLKIILLPTCVLFYILFPSLIGYTQTIYDDINDLKQIELYIHEGEYSETEPNEKKYIYDYPLEKYFSKYDQKHLPKEKDYKRRMYTLKGFLIIDDNIKDEVLSLYMGPIDYPANIYLNKVLIHKAGRYKKSYNSTIYTASNIILPNELLLNNAENEIAVELFPQYEIRPFSKIYVSVYKKVSNLVFWRNFFNVYLIQASVFLSILILINIIINIFFRKYTKSEFIKYMYFCFVCIFFCCSYISITFYSVSFNEILLEKISRIGFSLMGVAYTLFIIKSTNILSQKVIPFIVIITGTALSIITAFQQTKEGIRHVFDFIMFIEIIPLLAFNLTLLLISIIKYKNKASLFILIALILISVLGIHDILALSVFVRIPYAWLTAYGYIVLVLALYIILSIEHSIVYKKLVTKNKIIKHNMKLAKRVQKQFVKKINHNTGNYHIYTYYKPMDVVSGDFYEILKINDDDIGILISDVSGHGIGSGIVTSMLKILCKSSKNITKYPNKFLKFINKNLTGIIGNNFVTAFYGIINYDKMTFTYSNASHCYPILFRRSDGLLTKLKSTGGMIGIAKGLDYSNKDISIKKGDVLLFFTDGLIETMNKNRELFGYDKIFDTIIKFKNEPINIIVNKLVEESTNFSGRKDPIDDLSMVCIEVL